MVSNRRQSLVTPIDWNLNHMPFRVMLRRVAKPW